MLVAARIGRVCLGGRHAEHEEKNSDKYRPDHYLTLGALTDHVSRGAPRWANVVSEPALSRSV